MTREATPDPRTNLRGRRFATVTFVALILLSAGIKWYKGWLLGAAIVVALHRWLTVRMGLTLAALLLSIALQVVGGDANSPVASLGMTLVFMNLAGNLVSPFVIRPTRFEAIGRDSNSEVSA